MEWQKIGPVLISILLIVVIAVARAYSRTLAAIAATMPVNITLALWIVASAEGGRAEAMSDFAGSMVRGIAATLVFVLVAWLAARRLVVCGGAAGELRGLGGGAGRAVLVHALGRWPTNDGRT